MDTTVPHISRDDDDIALMCAAAEGDDAAFALLVRRHRARVVEFLYRLCWNREMAEDGAQEAFLKLWMSRRRYQPSARFTTFLYQIARNQWLDQLRKERARPVESPLPEVLAIAAPLVASSSGDPHHQLFARYEQWRLRQAIRNLPDIYRIVFVLAHLEDLKLAQISQILDIPEGTVKSRLHKSIRLLRLSLAPPTTNNHTSTRKEPS